MSDSPGSSRNLVILALIVGLAVGLGVAFFLGRGGDGGGRTPVATGTETRDGDPEAFVELPAPDEPIDPSDAEDPEMALRGFLAQEAAGDWEDSYEFLAESLRSQVYTSAAAWVRAHADFPNVVAYRVDDVQVDDEAGTATVQTLTGFDPKLDPVLGLVAARGRSRWAMERNDDGLWRVNTTLTENQPLYPDSMGAADALRQWVDARVACEDTADLESGLIGTRTLAARLCEEDQDEPVEIGEIGPLSDSGDVSALLSEFGPPVFNWARTARVEGNSPFTAVLGPIGEEWRVVAIIGPGL